MENQIINNRIPTHSDKVMDYENTQVEFYNQDSVARAELRNENKRRFQKNIAQKIKRSNRGRKYLLMMFLKKKFPEISLKEFCDLYVKSDNVDDIDDNETFRIADSVEEDYLRGRKKRKARRKRRRAKRKTKRVARRKRIRKKLKKIGGNIKKRFIGMTLLAPLLPFKPMMRKALKNKGYSSTPKTPFVDIVTQFYKRVVKKGKNYEELADDWYLSDPIMYKNWNDFESYEDAQDHVVASALSGIVKGVLDFIKKSRNKKKNNVRMSSTEKIAADATDTLIRDHELKTTSELRREENRLFDQEARSIDDQKMKGDMSKFIIPGIMGLVVLLLVLRK